MCKVVAHLKRLWLRATGFSQTVHRGAFRSVSLNLFFEFGHGFISTPAIIKSNLCVADRLL